MLTPITFIKGVNSYIKKKINNNICTGRVQNNNMFLIGKKMYIIKMLCINLKKIIL